MKTINLSDIIFATVTMRGRALVNLTLSGVASIKDVLRRVMAELGHVNGIITLHLRNYSAGWNHRFSYNINL